MSPADLADYADETQNNKNSINLMPPSFHETAAN